MKYYMVGFRWKWEDAYDDHDLCVIPPAHEVLADEAGRKALESAERLGQLEIMEQQELQRYKGVVV